MPQRRHHRNHKSWRETGSEQGPSYKTVERAENWTKDGEGRGQGGGRGKEGGERGNRTRAELTSAHDRGRRGIVAAGGRQRGDGGTISGGGERRSSEGANAV